MIEPFEKYYKEYEKWFENNKDLYHAEINLSIEKIKETAELMPLNIHLTTTTYNSFIQMIKSNELTVGSEVLKNNIILIGIEDYYRLLKNAQ